LWSCHLYDLGLKDILLFIATLQPQNPDLDREIKVEDFQILSKECAQLYIADYGTNAVVRISGRATFVSSVPFKKLVNALIDRGCKSFTLDLSDCQLMDSTFLGVLVGLSRKFVDSVQSILLFNPSEQVREMFDNLGILDLFGAVDSLSVESDLISAVPNDGLTNKSDLAKNSLMAHQALMDVNRENEVKFKEVALFLEENLKDSLKGVSAD